MALGIALLSTIGAALILVAESAWIADEDLRYPVVLLTKVAAGIMIVVLTVRVGTLMVREHMLRIAPHLHEEVRIFGKVALVTTFCLIGVIFGLSLTIRDKSGSRDYLPIAILVVFGAMAAYGLRYLWREWKAFVRLRKDA